MADLLSNTKSHTRPARSGYLNTIIEDNRESQFDRQTDQVHKPANAGRPALANPPVPTRTNRIASPESTTSSSSDHHWPRRNPDFDDYYDATDDDDGNSSDSCPSLCSQGNSDSSKSSKISSMSSTSRNKYPAIVIPSSAHWASLSSYHKNSPVPPTPPPKIPVSPEVLSRLPRFVPEVHAPPSLDGSAVSDQPSTLSAPRTPELEPVSDIDWDAQYLRVRTGSGMNGDTDSPNSATMSPQVEIEMDNPQDWSHVLGRFPRISVDELPNSHSPISVTLESGAGPSTKGTDSGVELPTNALATLQHIELDPTSDSNSDVPEMSQIAEMQQIQIYPSRPRSMNATIPSSAGSNPFTPLSIPSPGGFFSSLGGEARHTWCINTVPLPSSAIAENFYNCPWKQPVIPDGSSTANYGLGYSKSSTKNGRYRAILGNTVKSDRNSIIDEYDELYDQELKFQASVNIDRTSIWLAAQTTYLAALRETNPVNKVEGSPTIILGGSLEDTSALPTRTTSVKLLAPILEDGTALPSPHIAESNYLFYRGFQRLARKSRLSDTFLHSNLRFEVLQVNRVSFMDKHVDQLVGKYALNAPVRPPYRGPFSQAPRNSTVPQILADQAKFSKLEKEQDATHQLYSSLWAVEALKFLKGGRLLPAPATKRLAQAKAPLGSSESAGSRRVRVLDLGGHPSCDWAWLVANDHRNVKVYTVITKQQVVNPGMKGPSNHRQVSVPQVWRLPFRDNQFDVISSRTFHALLKAERPYGEEEDEYDLCLKECFRCLKPGGILEFFVMDSEISRAGPYGAAVSVEFGFNLKTRGYDPAPTKSFMSRLQKAYFVGTKRAWMFLPLGAGPSASQPSQHQPNKPDEVGETMGSTASVASTTGLLGGWMWEQWMLKLQMEMGRERGKLLEEIPGVYAEGQKSGAGWKCLNGWAMKPKNCRRDLRR
ncbi:hypothetical protein FQN55_005366 [Onygenales sp. PD_40]|nr:hypothetical protein FQN55_005366 [Onygenales sp. PD_40]KAK2767277.1 hypothetical protein FQN53_006524 [Emmonsiellopsis sp. PD_33]